MATRSRLRINGVSPLAREAPHFIAIPADPRAGAMVVIPLIGARGAGIGAMVDTFCAEAALARRWNLGDKNVRTGTENYRMHQFVLDLYGITTPPGYTVDHIDRVVTNNCLSNLRFADAHGQCLNRTQPIASSGAKGVTVNKPNMHGESTYTVTLVRFKRKIGLGTFKTLEAAKAAYEAGAKEWDANPAMKSKPRTAFTDSGFKGVFVEKGRIRARITIDGRPKHIGVFATKEEASAAYQAAVIARDAGLELPLPA